MNEPMLVGRDPNDPMVAFIQSRADVDYSVIDEYAAQMTAGVEFEPAQGLLDIGEERIYVWDGYHRGQAALKAGLQLWIAVEPGSRQEAEWLALTANQKHGLRRTTKDKQRIVQNALLHPNGLALSNREIGRHTGVDHKTVGRIRRELEASGEIPQVETRTVTRGDQTFEVDTSNIGTQQPEYLQVWQIESLVRGWLNDPKWEAEGDIISGFAYTEDGKIDALTWVKERTDDGKWVLEQMGKTISGRHRPGDLWAACMNVLEQLRQERDQQALDPSKQLADITEWMGNLRKIVPAMEDLAGQIEILEQLSHIEEYEFVAQDLRGTLKAIERVVQEGEEIDIDAVSWLLGVPANDANFTWHLKRSNLSTLRYTMALIPNEPGHVVRSKKINSRINALWKEQEQESNDPPQKLNGRHLGSATMQGHWYCQLCEKQQNRGTTRTWVRLDDEDKDRGICEACVRNRVKIGWPTCYLCNVGNVGRFKGYIHCSNPRCGGKWGNLAKVEAGRVEHQAQAFEPAEPQPAPRDSVLCPKCDQAIFPDQDTRPDGSIVCDACKKKFKDYETLIAQVAFPDDGDPIPFDRRHALKNRASELLEIISLAPLDRLHELEAWFDEIETAFAAPPAWAIARNGETHA